MRRQHGLITYSIRCRSRSNGGKWFRPADLAIGGLNFIHPKPYGIDTQLTKRSRVRPSIHNMSFTSRFLSLMGIMSLESIPKQGLHYRRLSCHIARMLCGPARCFFRLHLPKHRLHHVVCRLARDLVGRPLSDGEAIIKEMVVRRTALISQTFPVF